jgi:hypothetical protein
MLSEVMQHAHNEKTDLETISDLEDWAFNTNFEELPLPDLVSFAQLYETYQKYIEDMTGSRDHSATREKLSAALALCGLAKVNKDRNVRVRNRPVAKYYAIRHVEKWLNAAHSELSQQINQQEN